MGVKGVWIKGLKGFEFMFKGFRVHGLKGKLKGFVF